MNGLFQGPGWPAAAVIMRKVGNKDKCNSLIYKTMNSINYKGK
jgi:hypothetical protein